MIIVVLILAVIVLAYLLIEQTGRFDNNDEAPLRPMFKTLLSQNQLDHITPAQVLARLKAGNQRFIDGALKDANYAKLIHATHLEQHPAAIVLSCIDSRVPPEIVFDQAIGNIFVSRVAGEVISPDIIAGMEYATAVTGSKLIVIMGHGNCGAVSAACKQVKLGNITSLLDKIQPAVTQAAQQMPGESCDNMKYVNQIAINNVKNIVAEVPKQSPIIKNLMDKGQVEIIGAMYDIDAGSVEFFDPET